VIRAIASLVLGVPVERSTQWSLATSGVVWLRRDDERLLWSLVRWNA
jgi:alpha-ribazole phosphatase